MGQKKSRENTFMWNVSQHHSQYNTVYQCIYQPFEKIFPTPLPFPKKERVPRRAVFINRLEAQHSLHRLDSGVRALAFSTQWFNLLLTYLGKYALKKISIRKIDVKKAILNLKEFIKFATRTEKRGVRKETLMIRNLMYIRI